jgi:plastocyanin
MTSTDNTVKMENLSFVPEVISIAAGTSVHWVNVDDVAHNVTSNPGTLGCDPSSSESFDSGRVEKGGTFDHTFNTPGSFSYHCEIHGCEMNGTIKVT